MRQKDGELLTNTGETTSRLMGFLYRTIWIVENGIKPEYVFDGKPPELKYSRLGQCPSLFYCQGTGHGTPRDPFSTLTLPNKITLLRVA
ncbi:hypothetical protein BC826DRAFT_995191 [Russula brevipes]|nr:hypothetical protein BC826DRAFT_995191 [Russula brevipes]